MKILGEILDCELVSEPFMVRTLKTFLKVGLQSTFRALVFRGCKVKILSLKP